MDHSHFRFIRHMSLKKGFKILETYVLYLYYGQKFTYNVCNMVLYNYFMNSKWPENFKKVQAKKIREIK